MQTWRNLSKTAKNCKKCQHYSHVESIFQTLTQSGKTFVLGMKHRLPIFFQLENQCYMWKLKLFFGKIFWYQRPNDVQPAKSVWIGLMKFWLTMFTEYLNMIFFEHGIIFLSEKRSRLLEVQDLIQVFLEVLKAAHLKLKTSLWVIAVNL